MEVVVLTYYTHIVRPVHCSLQVMYLLSVYVWRYRSISAGGS